MVEHQLYPKDHTTQFFARLSDGVTMVNDIEGAGRETTAVSSFRRSFGLLPVAVVTYVGASLGAVTMPSISTLSINMGGSSARQLLSRELPGWDARGFEAPGIAAAPTIADRIVVALGALEAGWAGPGSVPPSQLVIDNLEKVLDRMPHYTRMPEVEVEEDDGSVALRWVADTKEKSFSLVFQENGRVTSVLATLDPPRSATARINVGDEAQLASLLDESEVREAITA